MKKYIFMAVAGMLALSSCSNDDNEQTTQNAPRQMTFTAGFGDDGLTRASLNGSTKKVSFDTNDAFSVFSENNTQAVEFTTTDGTNFSGTAEDASQFYAVYPHKTSYTFDSNYGVISGISIPFDQSDAASSTCGWDPDAPIAYATTTGTSFTFHNLCALLKVTNNKNHEVAIHIIDIDDKAYMAGDFNYIIGSGKLTERDPKYSGVEVDGVPAGKTVYLAIAPCTVDHLVAIWLGDTKNGRKGKNTSVTFEAGKIYDLGNVSAWNDPMTQVPVP